ncbi:MAG: methionine--tRNA ligase [Chlamydiae bacterium RIFCSPHIGHO2_12_FULL_44_59]|nr:MAG: methionine--tRNA ligase [Chlamydiae bacterium RIFCSPHIGHO2_01_FULL_44_39]OGN59092.1 MAG: methionine--tRNA ligase [Chlamydiae bacterium RIFCSPHIGHO2_02_FULL_45_9]OGN60290.1 MAG: methionine--tRNA ligase [Chlamydiae bacterium RIFCSPHIGHO2_12_FULL_44_59]OGN67057.1 MAG: methionine--tRNA ligase [Chlamydiae bacterium RIFCSPLOWO2_01_FULL_44_52]OGN67647.1 MAG: methionine--tRNA ligase [Chlamydiae bacterium RIFCSPLOWO2_02_FULL_45_22]OGN71350.1 MAG: methionine--tRNA ligase [Chlamydiae bacterium RI
MQKILITSALPYANGPLHFGHIAGAYLPGDCYARFQRLKGSDVLYICGSDEHGVAITLSAALAHRTPKEHVDIFHEMNRRLFEKLQFSFDYYGRTSWQGHALTTQDFFHALSRKGLIEERTEDHLYSEEEKRFLADRYVVGTCPKCGFQEARGDECQSCASSYEATDLKNPRSKLSGASLTLRPSNHLYLRFDRFKEQLKGWIANKAWKDNVVHFAMQYINDLKPRAITRDSDWGIPVPGYPGKVFYVWFDAPIGYISMTQEWAIQQGKAELWKDYWLNPDCKLVHFIGKDNIPFHAVFFPAMLMGQDESYILPDQIPANEFLNLEGRQFSKSDGWYIDLEDFFKQYTADQARYSIAANAPETSDSEFSWKDFQMRCNSELLGKLGNFVNRVLVFINQHGEGMVSTIGECEEGLQKQMQHLVAAAALSFESFHLRKATQILMELASLGNAYFDHQKPWALAKDPKRKDKLKTVLGMSVECIKNLALVASPMIPETAQKIWEMLGFQTELARGSWEKIHKTPVPEGQKLGKVEVLFQKVEDMEIEKQMEKLGESVAMHEHPSLQPLKAEVSYGDFDKMDFRIGQIVAAEKVAKSKKLLKLLVDLGFTQRTVVSGISLHYKPEDLIGKKVVVVANLQPTKIMGIESAGMILAASIGDQLELPYIQCLPPGSKVV